MYDWLNELPADRSAQLLTPNRRLARSLRDAHAAGQVAAGRLAWLSPQVHAVQDWYRVLLESLPTPQAPGILLSDQQSRVLWEDCLRQEIADPFVSIAALARICRDTWQRLHEWAVPLERARDSAQSPDQQLFARVALRYLDRLQQQEFVDAALVPEYLASAIPSGALPLPRHIWCCGFDRRSPRFAAVLAACADRGSALHEVESASPAQPRLFAFTDPDAELRAAGAWARAELERDPGLRIAVVVSRLELDAPRSAALLREGLAPGWQAAAAHLPEPVDLSYGRRLAELPAIHVALLVLRWFQQPLRAAEVALLLRTPFLGMADSNGRSRLELRLRQWPDREWRLERLLAALDGRDPSADAVDWVDRFRRARQETGVPSGVAGPARWAEQFERWLTLLGWPGQAPLASDDYQLDNRWRKLLNEFARLELVAPRMTGLGAVTRLAALAAEVLFQPETPGAAVSLLGPLEAAGLEFDRIWLTGAVSTDWPPPSRPLALLSRELQLAYDMPDASPEDTARFARRVLRRITASAPVVILSYAEHIGDAEQVPTRLAGPLAPESGSGDPGWYAAQFRNRPLARIADRVPAVVPTERVGGGAYTVQRQSEEPFSAFASGRLGARPLAAFTSGIAANVRGNLVHAALAALYAGLPAQFDLRRWSAAERDDRIGRAIDKAFANTERFADDVLRQICVLERTRTARLLAAAISVDLERTAFAVARVEAGLDTVLAGVPLALRCDRVDRLADGGLAVIDYKTGQTRKPVGRSGLRELQLAVYACAIREPVSGLAYFNVAGRCTEISGTGPAFGTPDGWQEALDEWRGRVLRHAAEIAAGDVRVNLLQGLEAARDLSLLSRYPELYRGE